MKKCRITVMKTSRYDDLIEKYENPIEHACDLKQGQIFIADGKEKHAGKLLLTSIANGCYCGGGIKSNPLASVSDGMININIIKNVSRLKFLYLLPFYMKGSFLKLKNIDKVILSEKCFKVKITPLDGKIRLCVDGEIIDGGETEFEICHHAFRFVLPAEQGLFQNIAPQYQSINCK